MMLIRAPVGTRSGYGDMSRDIVRHLINLDKWDIKIISCPWGNTPMNSLTEENPKDKPIIDRLLTNASLPKKPEVFISITVPNEFEPIAHYNIGITAGIETTACAPEWITGMNKMNLILTISNYSKKVLQTTVYDAEDQQTKIKTKLKLTTPIEVLHNCVDTEIFKKTDEKEELVEELMSPVKENFAFLFVGHWLQGVIGQDRKDVGMLIRVFLETFRKVPSKQRPALILKTSGAGFSVLEREALLKKIETVRNTVNGKNLPSVYLLHGSLTEPEMNALYNHPKVKAHVSFTKGEGFGRPLLEASMSGKPIVASGWSGHLDFLNSNDAILLGGALEKVDPSAVQQGIIQADTQWFRVDYQNAANVLHHVWKHYKQFSNRGAKLIKKNAEQFCVAAIQDRTDELMTKYLPVFKVTSEVNLNLPTGLPSLKKIEVKSKKSTIKKVVVKKKDFARNYRDLRSAEKNIEKATMEAPEGAVPLTVVGVKGPAGLAMESEGELQKVGVEVDV